MKHVVWVEPETVCQLREAKKTLLGMSCEPDTIIKEASVNGLGNFTAYANGAVKVQFTDRTILRLQKGCDAIRLLDRYGHELTFIGGAFPGRHHEIKIGFN